VTAVLEVERLAAGQDPHDLRHAAVSTWLDAGTSPTRVTEWAGWWGLRRRIAIAIAINTDLVEEDTSTAVTRLREGLPLDR
jgi:hypothetical protein